MRRGESQKRIENTKTENIKKKKKNINTDIPRRDLTRGPGRVLEVREDQDPEVRSGDQEADRSGDQEADQSH